jgi:hypothetical protein
LVSARLRRERGGTATSPTRLDRGRQDRQARRRQAHHAGVARAGRQEPVYPDADQDWAVDGIIAAMRFTRQSQSCNKQFTKVCKYVDEGLKRREFSLEGMPDSFTQRKSVTVNLAV